MTNKPEELKKVVAEIKEQMAKQAKASKEPKKDAKLRGLRKKLKRAQRRLKILTPVPLPQRAVAYQKHLDIIGKILSDLTKATKKTAGDAKVHSLRKKVKSFNKRIKKVNRLLKNHPVAEAAAAPVEAAAEKKAE